MKVKLRELMYEKGLTAYYIAKVINVAHQTVYSWINGRTMPCKKNIDKLCTLLDCEIGDLYQAEKIDFAVFCCKV